TAPVGGMVASVVRSAAEKLISAHLNALRIALACFVALLLQSGTALVACTQCEVLKFVPGDGVNECMPKPAGTVCTNGFCDNLGNCIVPPGTPGPISGSSGSSSTTGSYTLSWGSAIGLPSDYKLYENGVVIYDAFGFSTTISGRGNGTYTY